MPNGERVSLGAMTGIVGCLFMMATIGIMALFRADNYFGFSLIWPVVGFIFGFVKAEKVAYLLDDYK